VALSRSSGDASDGRPPLRSRDAPILPVAEPKAAPTQSGRWTGHNGWRAVDELPELNHGDHGVSIRSRCTFSLGQPRSRCSPRSHAWHMLDTCLSKRVPSLAFFAAASQRGASLKSRFSMVCMNFSPRRSLGLEPTALPELCRHVRARTGTYGQGIPAVTGFRTFALPVHAVHGHRCPS
jgi:hypothetical protein